MYVCVTTYSWPDQDGATMTATVTAAAACDRTRSRSDLDAACPIVIGNWPIHQVAGFDRPAAGSVKRTGDCSVGREITDHDVRAWCTRAAG